MRIASRLERGRPVVSFPPKTEAGDVQPYGALADLKRLGSSFVSVTGSAGGSTRCKAVELATRIHLCDARIPEELAAARAEADDDSGAARDVGGRWVTCQCRELLEGGAPGLHLCTRNRAPATRRISESLFS